MLAIGHTAGGLQVPGKNLLTAYCSACCGLCLKPLNTCHMNLSTGKLVIMMLAIGRSVANLQHDIGACGIWCALFYSSSVATYIVYTQLICMITRL